LAKTLGSSLNTLKRTCFNYFNLGFQDDFLRQGTHKTASTGGSIFAGTKTKIANSTINPNEKYASIAQIDSSGNVETQVELKMNINYDKSASIIQTTDGDYVFTGSYIYADAHQLSLSNVSWIMKITQQPTQSSVTSQPGSPFILSSLELPIVSCRNNYCRSNNCTGMETYR
jgi:hypothetical protein